MSCESGELLSEHEAGCAMCSDWPAAAPSAGLVPRYGWSRIQTPGPAGQAQRVSDDGAVEGQRGESCTSTLQNGARRSAPGASCCGAGSGWSLGVSRQRQPIARLDDGFIVFSSLHSVFMFRSLPPPSALRSLRPVRHQGCTPRHYGSAHPSLIITETARNPNAAAYATILRRCLDRILNARVKRTTPAGKRRRCQKTPSSKSKRVGRRGAADGEGREVVMLRGAVGAGNGQRETQRSVRGSARPTVNGIHGRGCSRWCVAAW